MPIMSDEDAVLFVDSESSPDAVSKLTVAELRLVATHLGATDLFHLPKAGLVSIVLQQLGLDEERADSPDPDAEGGDGESEGASEPEDDPEVRRIELQVKLEEAKNRTLETQLRIAELEASKGNGTSSSFDLGKASRLVPDFNEGNVDTFFSSFERLATRLKWPKDQLTLLLQRSLKGKALKAYMALSDADACSYEKVKSQVLQAYSLVPEAYRQKFRALRKVSEHSHLELARAKREAFVSWCRAKNVKSFEQLEELVLIEAFMQVIDREVAVYLAQRDITTLEEAATIADNFSLSRKDSRTTVSRPVNGGSSSPTFKRRMTQQRPPNSLPQGKGNSKPAPTGRTREIFKCTFCGRTGHKTEYCWRRLQLNEPARTVLATVSAPEAETKTVCVVSPTSESLEVQPDAGYNSFISGGSITGNGITKPVRILRDSGALQTLLKAGVVTGEETGEWVVLSSIGGHVSAPLVRVHLESDCFKGEAKVAITPDLPVQGIQLLLGNDLAGEKMGGKSLPVLQEEPSAPVDLEQLEADMPKVFPLCAVTRSMSKKAHETESPVSQSPVPENEDTDIDLSFLFPDSFSAGSVLSAGDVRQGKEALIAAQRADESLAPMMEQAEMQERDAAPTTSYHLKEGVLYRRWLPPTYPREDAEWAAVEQLMVPVGYRQMLLEVAHDGRFAGHMGTRKSLDKLTRLYYWPGIRSDVARHCKECLICQRTGKPNQKISPAPLVKIPHLPEPFAILQVDVVGPLPRTRKGHEYLLTLVDTATRYVNAVPLRKVSAGVISNHLLTFFSCFGFPVKIQTDGASYFCGKQFDEFCKSYGIRHAVSSPYHPQSQGAVERSHQTMKSLLRKFALQFSTDWDDNIPYILFVMRDSPSESTGFSPFDLLFAHRVRGPLSRIRDLLLGSGVREFSLLEWVGSAREKLLHCWQLAAEHLDKSQSRAKRWFDKRAVQREFAPGDRVLVLLPHRGNPFEAKFQGPFEILKKLSDTTYVVSTPGRRRRERLCHVNALKGFVESTSGEPMGTPVCLTRPCPTGEEEEDVKAVASALAASSVGAWQGNSAARAALASELGHLAEEQRSSLLSVLDQYPQVIKDSPGRTNEVIHDIDIGDAKPIKQSPYRVHPRQVPLVKGEIDTMLKLGIIRPGKSEWSSPVVLVPKSDGTHRFCIDFRRVNKVIKKDAYPLPRIDECIEKIGSSKFISKLDLLKGFWQIGLTAKAQEICSFSTLGQTYLPLVLPFGLSNSPSSFQRLMNQIREGIPNVAVYLDDVVVFSDTWEEHIEQLHCLFDALNRANLVLNLRKCVFAKAQVQYLGHVVGLGELSPPTAKVEAIEQMPAPRTKKQVRRFLGTIGYYRRYIKNFALLAFPLTELLKKNQSFNWSPECQEAFQSLQSVLSSYPVLKSPDFCKPFKLACDASDTAVGAVLLQEDHGGVDHPIAYFSKKLNTAQTNYSTIEKELLSLILSLEHFSFYLVPSEPVTIYSDHRPLSYLASFKTKNQRLTRWSLFLQNYNINIIHIKGQDNVLADWLSRPSAV